MRFTAVFYDNEGRITSVHENATENTVGEAQYVAHDTVIDPDSHFVKGGAVVEKGEQPSEDYEFDYSLEQWVISIPAAQERKWNSIKRARNAQEFGSFEWGGYALQCDETSQRRIQGAVQLASINPDMTLDWTLADNSVQTFTAAEYIEMGQALAIHVSQCHERGRILRQQINDATTLEELEAIVW